jgi:hypothetical protein
MSEADQAMRIALDRKLLIACPMHPEEMIATADGSEVLHGLHPGVEREIGELLAKTPKVCPRCMDRDDG